MRSNSARSPTMAWPLAPSRKPSLPRMSADRGAVGPFQPSPRANCLQRTLCHKQRALREAADRDVFMQGLWRLNVTRARPCTCCGARLRTWQSRGGETPIICRPDESVQGPAVQCANTLSGSILGPLLEFQRGCKMNILEIQWINVQLRGIYAITVGCRE